jgi:hypothetical protein
MGAVPFNCLASSKCLTLPEELCSSGDVLVHEPWICCSNL